MPGFSGLSNHSCERRLLPRGCGVVDFFAMVFLPAIRMRTSARGCKTARCLISACESGELRRDAGGAPPMLYQLLAGGLVSIVTFGIHAVMTGLIVVVTH